MESLSQSKPEQPCEMTMVHTGQGAGKVGSFFFRAHTEREGVE